MRSQHDNRANKTDAGNGSKAICRVSNVPPSPSPDPRRSAVFSRYSNLNHRFGARTRWKGGQRLNVSQLHAPRFSTEDEDREQDKEQAHKGGQSPPLLGYFFATFAPAEGRVRRRWLGLRPYLSGWYMASILAGGAVVSPSAMTRAR